MSKNVKVDFMNNTINVTKTFLKRAETPFTAEFKELVALQKELPSYKLIIQKSSCQKKQFRPTYTMMMDFIAMQPMNDELMEEFMKVKAIRRRNGNAYMKTLRWFNAKFPELRNYYYNDYEEMAA